MSAAPAFPSSGPRGPRRILVVDDDPDLRRLLCRMLGQAGYQVDSADDGSSAWDHLQSMPCDLLVTDHQMARLSGLGLVRRLRAAQWNLPVIMVSGRPPEGELRRQPWLNLSALLGKPFGAAELLSAVRGALPEDAGTRHLRVTPHGVDVSTG